LVLALIILLCIVLFVLGFIFNEKPKKHTTVLNPIEDDKEGKVYDTHSGQWLTVEQIQTNDHPYSEFIDANNPYLIQPKEVVLANDLPPVVRDFKLAKAHALELGFEVVRDGNANALKTLQQFEMVATCTTVEIQNVVKKDSISLFFVEVVSESDLCERLAIGYKMVDHDLGSGCIVAESLETKISDLIYPTEVKFEHQKLFSEKFWIIADQPEKIKANFGSDFMEAYEKNTDLLLEFKGRKVIMLNYKNANPEIVERLVDTLDKL